MDDTGNSSCAKGGNPITAAIKALMRFAVKHIPIFRKRAEKTAVNALLDKMKTASENQKDVGVEESARNRR